MIRGAGAIKLGACCGSQTVREGVVIELGSLPRRRLPNLRFNLRQTEQNGVADDLQAAGADLIERVFLRVPVIVLSGRATVLEVNDVDRGDSRAEKGHVVVIAHLKRAVWKFLRVAELTSSSPDR